MGAPGRIRAIEAAAEVLEDLNVDQSLPIDPFSIIEKLDLKLTIAHLDNLLGAMLPDGGVFVTSERQPTVQRYTAAHEIGHWMLHQQYLMDGESEIFGAARSETEREAQLFASYFLLPNPLLQAAINAHQVSRQNVTPEQLYLVSRDLNVSYEATARRLESAGYLTRNQVAELIRFGRLPALQRAFGGNRPEDGNADMWSVSPQADEESSHVSVAEHDEIVVMLAEHRMSGWRWLSQADLMARNTAPVPGDRPHAPSITRDQDETGRVDKQPNNLEDFRGPADIRAALALVPISGPSPVTVLANLEPDTDDCVALVRDQFASNGLPANPRELRRIRLARAGLEQNALVNVDEANVRAGGMGARRLTLRTLTPGNWALQVYYAHAYDPRIEPIDSYRVEVQVLASPTHVFQAKLLANDFDVRFPGDPDDDAVFEIDAP